MLVQGEASGVSRAQSGHLRGRFFNWTVLSGDENPAAQRGRFSSRVRSPLGAAWPWSPPHTHTHMCITHAAPTAGFPSPRDRPHHHVPLLMAMTARPHGSPCVGDLRRALWNWAVGGWGALGTPGKTESRGQTLPEVTGQWSRGCPQTQV